jgi:hypothetical protein
MLINRVVVNASPLICLFKSGLEDLFPSLFNDIVAPEAVIKEIGAKGEADFAAQTLISLSWIRRMGDVPVDPRVAAWDLGDGKVEKIIRQAQQHLPQDAEAKKKVEIEIHYLDKNASYMRYAEFRAQGL